eukprot:c33706_g1_i1 orf=3-407(-)
MAGTIHKLWMVSSSEERDWRCQQGQKESQHGWYNSAPSIDCWYNPALVNGELRGGDPAMSTQTQEGELCHKREKVIPDNAILCTQQSSSFVALLRACAKSKDLSTGTRLHDDILKRGLLDKCADALVTMYAKCGA